MMYNNRICVIDIETTSLKPWDGQIICIGIMDVDSEIIKVFYNESEKIMLQEFLEYFHTKKFNEIIAYNSSFDTRFIFGRCLKYNLYANGFFKSSVTDLMQIMKTGTKFYGSYNKAGKLDEWCEMVLGSGKLSLPDSILSLYEQGRVKEIIKYNHWDVKITYDLWRRVMRVFHND